MSGRITSIAVAPDDKNHWLIGTASGGLWRSRNAGTSFEPEFDDQPVQSIGAVAFAPSDPRRIYVGTGEGNPRNSQSSGTGVYRSLDGGETWEYLGLEDSRNIHRILVDPRDPDRVWLGVLGDPFRDSERRGIYRSEDGGLTWDRVLYRDARSGAADLVVDPADSERLFAALWDFRRSPWDARSGGPGSGLFVSADGGSSWTELDSESGLPAKPYGRIGIAFAPSDPRRVYALVESQQNALFRSDDRGLTWREINTETIGSRPFYFAEVHVDPAHPDRVYNLYSRLARSEDGGERFEVIEDWGREVHADYHAFWIDPEDQDFIIAGTDGGLYWSRDRGAHWHFAENLPLGQFYHVTVDDNLPYNIYGGLQDNGTWFGPSEVWNRAGLRNAYWRELAFNDGFDVVLDTEDASTVYALWQAGMLVRINTETGQRKTIAPISNGAPLRFNWNAAIARDPFRPGTIFAGSQYVHQSTDRGDSWGIISPDLTTNDPAKQQQLSSGGLSIDATGAENHTTITVIAPSKFRKDLIWVGSDDGRIHVRQKRRSPWEEVTGDLGGAPPGSVIRQIVPSANSAGEAFVVVDNHLRGDWGTYLLHTRDYGRTWTNMADETPIDGYALAFAQDPVEKRLMFLGTEFGLYVSLDAGRSWQAWQKGYPAVSTMDLAIQEREGDLVVGSFGRSIWILDDLQPWRELAAEPALRGRALHLFAPPDAYQVVMDQARGQRLSPDNLYAGDNNAREALISFWVQHPALREVRVTVDRDGETVRTWDMPVVQGLNRTAWDQQWEGKAIYGPLMSPDLEQPLAPPGLYRVTVAGIGEDGEPLESSASAELALQPDPRVDYRPDVYEANHRYRLRLEELQTTVDAAVEMLSCVDEHLATLKQGGAKAGNKGDAIQEATQALWVLLDFTGIQGAISDSPRLMQRISKAFYYTHSPYERLTANDEALLRDLEEQTQLAEGRLARFEEEVWTPFEREFVLQQEKKCSFSAKLQ